MRSNEDLTPTQKIGLSLLIFGTILDGILFYFIQRQWQAVRQKTTETKQQLDRLAVVERLNQDKLMLNNRFEELTAFFPDTEENVAKVAQKLETIAKDSQVEIKLTFDDFPKAVDIGGRYQEGLGTTVELKGSYQGMLKWIREVQQLPYFIRFSEIKVGTLEEKPGTRSELKGIIFLRNPK